MPITLSLAEAADLLGISRNTAYALVKSNEFPVPVLRVGKQLKVSRQAVEDFVNGVSQHAAS